MNILLARLILLIGGLNVTLPNVGWASHIRQVQLVHGLFVDNALVMLCLVLMALGHHTNALLKSARALRYAFMIMLLGWVGMFSAAVHPYLLSDLGEALRLFL